MTTRRQALEQIAAAVNALGDEHGDPDLGEVTAHIAPGSECRTIVVCLEMPSGVELHAAFDNDVESLKPDDFDVLNRLAAFFAADLFRTRLELAVRREMLRPRPGATP